MERKPTEEYNILRRVTAVPREPRGRHNTEVPLPYPDQYRVHVNTILEDGELYDKSLLLKDFIQPGFQPLSDQEDLRPYKLRWIHLPVNHEDAIERCVCKFCPDFPILAKSAWGQKKRPALPSQVKTPRHSRHMEPSCSVGENSSNEKRVPLPISTLPYNLQLTVPDGFLGGSRDEEVEETGARLPLIALYVPYLNWEIYGAFLSLQKAYAGQQVPVVPSPSMETQDADIMEYSMLESDQEGGGIHPRRTLDQFYYSSLFNTTQRDADQTISKWTGSGVGENGRSSAGKDSQLFMIDQLWCWALDNKTILTAFPSGHLQYGSRGEERSEDFLPLYECLKIAMAKSSDIWDFYSLIFKEAATHLFRHENKKFIDLVETYRWVISKKSAAQTIFFEDFHRAHSSKDSEHDLFDDTHELKLVLDVADIIDELKMLRHLVDKQRDVLKALGLALVKLNPVSKSENPSTSIVKMSNNTAQDNAVLIMSSLYQSGPVNMTDTIKMIAQGIAGGSRDFIIDADDGLGHFLSELESMKDNASYTHKMLLDLLDLKQKSATLKEARSTSEQGQVIMLFTIVTIIFLPLSFFTSYFGQNVSELTGDLKNPTTRDLWQYGAPISVVIIVVALLVAYFINRSRRDKLMILIRGKNRPINELADEEV